MTKTRSPVSGPPAGSFLAAGAPGLRRGPCSSSCDVARECGLCPSWDAPTMLPGVHVRSTEDWVLYCGGLSMLALNLSTQRQLWQQALRVRPIALLRMARLILASRPGLVKNRSCSSHEAANMWASTHTVTPVQHAGQSGQVIWQCTLDLCAICRHL